MQSKGLTTGSALLLMAFVGSGSLTFAACGVNYEFGYVLADAYPCDDPKYSDYHGDRCVDWRCESANAIPEDPFS